VLGLARRGLAELRFAGLMRTGRGLAGRGFAGRGFAGVMRTGRGLAGRELAGVMRTVQAPAKLGHGPGRGCAGIDRRVIE
jgi:hypothetical protein